MMPSFARAEPATLRLGFITASLHLFQSLPLYIAQQKGMLEREEIKLDIVALPGVDHMIAALDDGRVDVTSTAMPYLIKGVLRGSDAVAVVGGPANTISTFVARPEIKTFADLKGKTIGLSLPADVISIGARQLLAKNGLREPDYDVKELVGTPVRAKCLESGECAAVPLSQPDDILFVRKGYRALGNSYEVLPILQFTVFAARRSWANQQKDLLVRFARAMGEAYAFMAKPENRAEVMAMGATRTGAAPDVVSQIYDLYYEPYRGALPKHGEINVPGISKTIELLGGTGQLNAPLPPADKFIDLQVLQGAGMQ
jgi:ABC-type nitrate/sulfonate/bicarbonate transport system substrate-binding protein